MQIFKIFLKLLMRCIEPYWIITIQWTNQLLYFLIVSCACFIYKILYSMGYAQVSLQWCRMGIFWNPTITCFKNTNNYLWLLKKESYCFGQTAFLCWVFTMLLVMLFLSIIISNMLNPHNNLGWQVTQDNASLA